MTQLGEITLCTMIVAVVTSLEITATSHVAIFIFKRQIARAFLSPSDLRIMASIKNETCTGRTFGDFKQDTSPFCPNEMGLY